MCARDQSSIFSTGGKFRPDYGLLLELHALTLVARSYTLLLYTSVVTSEYPQDSHTVCEFCEFCAGNRCLTLQGVCESVLYGTPHILKPTTCWKLDWEELERNHHHFNALCQLLQNRVRTRDSSSKGVADPKPLQL